MKYLLFAICMNIVLSLFPYSEINAQTIYNDQGNLTNMEKSNSPPHGRFGKLTAQSGRADELLDIILKAAEAVSQAEGCMKYIIGRDEQNENIIWIYEVWTSKEHHRNSLKLENVRELITQAIPMLEGQPEAGVTFEVIGGIGI